MGKTWKVAVIGLGHWYSAYGLARGLAEYPHARLAAVAAEDPAQLAAFTSTFGVPGYADYREMLAREAVDIVHVAAPVSQIPEIAIAAARAGKHLVLGKPMAMTVAEADRIVEAVEGAGVQCMPFQGIMRLRFAETVRRIRQGDIGDLLVLHQTSPLVDRGGRLSVRPAGMVCRLALRARRRLHRRGHLLDRFLPLS